MKAVITTVMEFFSLHGMTVHSVSLKLTNRGQVERCTCTFDEVHTSKAEVDAVLKAYRKNLTCADYRFVNTVLEISGHYIIITKQ